MSVAKFWHSLRACFNRHSLSVRFSTPEDIAKVYDFHKKTSHQHVDLRKPEVMEERTKNGRVIIFENQSDNMCGMSVCYDFHKAANPAHHWVEIGSTRAVSGLGIYPFIIASQVVQEFLTHPAEDKFIANVYDDNGYVLDKLGNVTGWHIFTPEDDILTACKATKGDTNPHGAKRIWFTATSDTIPGQARIILDHIKRGTDVGFLNKKTGETIRLDVARFPLANDLRPMVTELAYGAFGKYLEQNPHTGLREAREQLGAHMSKAGLQSPKAGL